MSKTIKTAKKWKDQIKEEEQKVDERIEMMYQKIKGSEEE